MKIPSSYYISDYKIPLNEYFVFGLSIDCVVFGYHEGEIKVLLIQRGVEPFKGHWALIGDLVDPEINLRDAANKVLEKRKFRTVVIDEAAQALEPATWIPILKASKVVLTGDPFQLPPTVKSETARRQGFDVTMLEKCLRRLDRSSLLNVVSMSAM